MHSAARASRNLWQWSRGSRSGVVASGRPRSGLWVVDPVAPPPSGGLLEELGSQGGPSCLVAGPDTPAVIAVEILVERDPVAEPWVGLEVGVVAEDRPRAGGVAQEQADQPVG